MKKIIIFLAIVLGGVSAITAQDYVPLVREGVKWECTNYLIRWGSFKESPYTIELKGDTIFNDYNYKKCLFVSEGDTTLHALLREDIEKQQVYMIFIHYPERKYRFTFYDIYDYGSNDLFEETEGGLTKEILLYDFKQPAKTSYLELNEIGDNDISIENIIIAGEERKRIRVTGNDGTHRLSLIEGIGVVGESDFNVSGYFDGCLVDYAFIDRTPDGTYGFSVFHRLVKEDGTIIYEAPYISGGVKSAISGAGADAVEVARYDVHGRRLAKPVPGINIVRMSDGTTRKEIEKNVF